jgi:4-amino-4-deoxy-L-arabinose transferase-like glycosyltransferase
MSTDIINDKESIKQKTGSAFSGGNAPWIIMAALVVLLCIYVRVRLLSVPLERDEGEFAYFAQLMLRGVPPYLHAYTLKFPGAPLMYALFMLLFGQSAWGIHFGLLIVSSTTIVMVYLLARSLFGPEAGFAAAAAYAVLSLSQGVYGVFAHATHFVVLFALAGYLLLMRALESGRTAILFYSGLCFGLAILMKQHGIFFALFALLYFLWERRERLAGGWQRLTRDSLLFVAATAVPFGVCCLVLLMYGTFDKFWFWTFEYAREYVTYEPFHKGVRNFQRLFGRIVQTSLFLWVAAGTGVVLLFADKEAKRGRVFAAGLLFFSGDQSRFAFSQALFHYAPAGNRPADRHCGRFGRESACAKGYRPLFLGHSCTAFFNRCLLLSLPGEGVLLFHGPRYGQPLHLW